MTWNDLPRRVISPANGKLVMTGRGARPGANPLMQRGLQLVIRRPKKSGD